MTRAEKIAILYALVGERMALNLYISKQGRGEFLAADVYLRPYYFIDGDFDLAAYGRTIRSANRRGFPVKAVFVIATGFEKYQDPEHIRFHRVNDIRPGLTP